MAGLINRPLCMVRLALLVAHRADLMEDWMRTINRLRRLMVGVSPMAECALTLTRIRRRIDRSCHAPMPVIKPRMPPTTTGFVGSAHGFATT
jgi:hypothetical protein